MPDFCGTQCVHTVVRPFCAHLRPGLHAEMLLHRVFIPSPRASLGVATFLCPISAALTVSGTLAPLKVAPLPRASLVPVVSCSYLDMFTACLIPIIGSTTGFPSLLASLSFGVSKVNPYCFPVAAGSHSSKQAWNEGP